MSEHKPIGKTARGLAVYPVTHPSYSHLERTHAVGADAQHLAKLAQAAHPSYRAVDHEEASVMHHARRNMQAARAHEAASLAMSKALPPEALPASDSSLAWVYEGAAPDMTPREAATAIQAATLGWTQQDHLQMGALQHHLAVGFADDPERQAVCSAAAYMHVAAAGLDPASLLNKGLDPKVLRPKLGTKPVQIGKTRSGKPIYNMFTHPAHASFTTADHVDHIEAMAAHQGRPKMRKSSAATVQNKHQKLNLQGCGLRAAQEPVMNKSEAVSILEQFLNKASRKKATAPEISKLPATHAHYSKVLAHPSGHKEAAAHVASQFPHYGFAHHMAAAQHYHNLSANAGDAHSKISEAHMKAASGKIRMVPVIPSFAHKSMNKSGKGEGSRGGKVIGHTKSSGKPIYGAGGRHTGIKTVNDRGDIGNFKSNLGRNAHLVEQSHKDYSSQDHLDAAAHLRSKAKEHKGGLGEGFFSSVASAHKYVAGKKAKKSMSKSDIMGIPVKLDDAMQGSPIESSYVDTLGGSHDLFMQQAELANCPTMWAPIATVPEN